jgi:hypothetical protein
MKNIKNHLPKQQQHVPSESKGEWGMDKRQIEAQRR